MKILLCGGAGFIGSHFATIRLLQHNDSIVVLDKLTYAGRRQNLAHLEGHPSFAFVHGAIESPKDVQRALSAPARAGEPPFDAIVNFAAETHVDRSIAAAHDFIQTNLLGTNVLLEAAIQHRLRYVQVSTDEVYGSIEEGTFTELSPLAPSSPYAASKAGADLLVLSCCHTHGLHGSICRGSNNYGPRQYPEKLIPLIILNALHNDPLPVYGDGRQVRNWIHVTDFASAVGIVLEEGAPGEVYNAGGPDECANIDVVERIVALTSASPDSIEHIADRPGHDRRYSLSSEKVRALGWRPRVRFNQGLADTVAWYRDNVSWWEPIRSGEYRAYYERQYDKPLRSGPAHSTQ